MQWFKHDSASHMDAKLKRVIIKYGMSGYGLYWYCIELIVRRIDANNTTFELDHDAEIIAHDTGINYKLVEEMMAYMVELELFERSTGIISCLRLAENLSQSMTSNPTMRALISKIKSCPHHDPIMTPSCPDKIRLDKIRSENNNIDHEPSAAPAGDGATKPQVKTDNCPHQQIIDLYHTHCPTMRKMKIWNPARAKQLRCRWTENPKHQSLEFWGGLLKYANQSEFLRSSSFCDLDWMTKAANFAKLIEGKYHND